MRRPRVLRQLRSWLVGGDWLRQGRRALLRRDPEGAVRAFERAARCRPQSIVPLLHLTMAWLAACDRARAREVLARARRLDPDRFRREAPGWLARQGLDPLLLAGLLAHAGRRPRRDAPVARPPVTAPPVAGPADLPWGDCRNLDEYARFRAMPPISRAEVDGVDWEETLRDLLEE